MAKTIKSAPKSTIISQRARPEILGMSGYKSARLIEKSNNGNIFLDANECAFEPFIGAQNLSRYPEQQPIALQEAICRWLDVSKRHITITRGADEAIDCLVRAFCVPSQDNIVICPPTFAMYAQSATLQNTEVRQAKLDKKFDLNVDAINQITDMKTKIIFVCSPNNPTANLMSRERILQLCVDYSEKALVVVDETYVEFANSESLIPFLDAHANLAICGCWLALWSMCGALRRHRTFTKSAGTISLAAASYRCSIDYFIGEVTIYFGGKAQRYCDPAQSGSGCARCMPGHSQSVAI